MYQSTPPFLMYTLRAIHTPIRRLGYSTAWFTMSKRIPKWVST